MKHIIEQIIDSIKNAFGRNDEIEMYGLENYIDKEDYMYLLNKAKSQKQTREILNTLR